MDFGQWLVHKRLLRRASFRDIMSEEFIRVFSTYHGADGYQTCSIDDLQDNLESLRQIPFGELLEAHPSVLQEVLLRSGKRGLDELTEDWYAWHCDHLEPICDYCLKNDMGEHLYRQQSAKKRVAQFLVDAHAANGGAIIRENDAVILPEGTSTLYVGLAIAAHKRKMTLHTSNSGLVHEYRHNPVLANRLKDFFIIGGKADWKYCEVEGKRCFEQYLNALSEDHAGTVLVIPVSRLTPSQGPAATGPSWKIRGDLVSKGLLRGVQRVVFIADHTKLAKEPGDDEHPIFTPRDWRRILIEHRDRILIVTSVPAGLQNAYDVARAYNMPHEVDVRRRNLDAMVGQQPFAGLGFSFSDADKAYDEVAKMLDEMVSDAMATRFLEVFDWKMATRRVILRFSALEGTVAHERMRAFLAGQLALPETSSRILLQLSWHGPQLTVEVRGDSQVLNRLHQLRQFSHTLNAAFADAQISLKRVIVEGTARHGPWKAESDQMPVNHESLMRSALGMCCAE
jgi:hypothetical protein